MAQVQVRKRSKAQIVKAAQQAVDTLIALSEYADQEKKSYRPAAKCSAMFEMASVTMQLAASLTLDEMVDYIRVGAEDNSVDCCSLPALGTLGEIAFDSYRAANAKVPTEQKA